MLSDGAADERYARAADAGDAGHREDGGCASSAVRDPAIEFAAAIMTRDGREAVSAEHARVARAGAQADRLLARNIGQLER
jgi:hypothetical protein